MLSNEINIYLTVNFAEIYCNVADNMLLLTRYAAKKHACSGRYF